MSDRGNDNDADAADAAAKGSSYTLLQYNKKIADFLRRKNSANTNCCCHVVALLHLNPLFLCVFFPLRRFLHSIPIFGGERLGDGLVYRQ